MKKSLVALAALVVSHSIALANPAAPTGTQAPAAAAPSGPAAPAPAAPLPPAANGLNEAPANPNWQNLDASSGAGETVAPQKRGKVRKGARGKAAAKKAKKAKKSRKARKHQRRHR